MRPIVRAILVFLLGGALASAAHAETLAGRDLVAALREGGYVIVMRHGQAPAERPDAATAEPGNPDRERQLDATGRETVAAMGAAFKTLGIPVGRVVSSPAFRARQTVDRLDVGEAETTHDLAEPEGMDPAHTEEHAAWLRALVGEAPAAGVNTLMVTHSPNIMAAWPEDAAGIEQGEALILRPDGAGGASVVGRVKVTDWPALVGG